MPRLIWVYSGELENLLDKKAEEMLEEFLAIEEGELKPKKSFVKEFSNDFRPKKVMRYYQMENKIEAGINYTLAENVPPIERPGYLFFRKN